MLIYNLLTGIIKLFSLAIFLIFVAVSAYLIWAGADITSLIGEIWFQYDSESLNLAQVIIERYVYYPLWLDWVVPYILQQPAYVVLPVGVFGSGFLTYLFMKL